MSACVWPGIIEDYSNLKFIVISRHVQCPRNIVWPISMEYILVHWMPGCGTAGGLAWFNITMQHNICSILSSSIAMAHDWMVMLPPPEQRFDTQQTACASQADRETSLTRILFKGLLHIYSLYYIRVLEMGTNVLLWMYEVMSPLILLPFSK